jgi:hypothetical protein
MYDAEFRRKYYRSNRERFKKYSRKYYEKNSDICKERTRMYILKKHGIDPLGPFGNFTPGGYDKLQEWQKLAIQQAWEGVQNVKQISE